MKPLNELVKKKIDPLDKLITGWNLEEIKKVLKDQSEINWKEREKDDEYWSGKVEERNNVIKKLKKGISSLKGQIKLAIQRKDYWKNKASQNINKAKLGGKDD